MGKPVIDAATGREGTVSGIGEPWMTNRPPDVVYVRPVGGGIEWRVPIDRVRPGPVPSHPAGGGR
ncbi:conserved protein of unknown function [Streptantibioticus cattleyicolor NRRL 8057 = DSM 46488]|nr:conserved protein of unknown function [Streptantibioticus cattleyicolor NRRL 8057 = DSM 46488]